MWLSYTEVKAPLLVTVAVQADDVGKILGHAWDFPSGAGGASKELACQSRRLKSCQFDPCVRKIPIQPPHFKNRLTLGVVCDAIDSM